MKTILLIMIGLSSLTVAQEAPRFTKVNGVVTDSKTTLEWQDEYSDNENENVGTWTGAIDYCESLSLNGKDDWRLPNKKELLSIVDYGTYNPSLNSAFQKITVGYYWSSTTALGSSNMAWEVNFFDGRTVYYYKFYNNDVRCVRAGQ